MAPTYRDRNITLAPISLILFLLSSSEYCRAVENITQLQKLPEDKTLVSPGRVFELGFFSPNNSATNRYVGIWYKNISPLTVLWVLNREKRISFKDSPASLTISENGNLELVDRNNNPIWSSKHGVSSNSSVATLTDSGNLVLTDVEANKTLWQSIDRLGDTFLSGSEIGYDGKTGENDVLTSWKSESDPSPGDFTLGISTKFFPAQAYILEGTRLHWRSGPWDGKEFTGTVDIDVRNNFGEQNPYPFEFIETTEQRTARIIFNPYSISAVSPKYFLSPQGVFKSTLKVQGSDRRTVWQSQKSLCDVYGFCGNFGVCKASKSPVICRCLKGYAPKSDSEWREQNRTQGCFRRTELLCQRNNSIGKNDGFHELKNIKLPDFYQYLSFPTNKDNCRKACVANCSCSAYAYVDGIGCLVWLESVIDVQEFSSGGKSLFLRLAHGELEEGKNAKNKIIISLATISIAVCLCVFLAICLHRRSVKRKENIEAISEKSKIVKTSSNFRSDIQLTEQKYQSESPIFSYESLSVATDNFSFSNKLGQGGFGPVYKGKLQNGTEIAVKRLSTSSGQGMREFQNEMVLVSKLQHRNLVRLFGFCTENDEKLLVYEYMPNKSLDNFIFDSGRSKHLDWTTRFNIIISIARGLVYLHRDSFLRVIHRDLKASNVLLGNKMNPKISDFGLAKIFEETFDVANTQRVVGSLGYMSPEYAMGGIFSEKSDVYSFGILMLEIVSGRKNTSFNFYDKHFSLVGCAWELWSEGREVEMVDKALENGFCSEEAMRCVHVGLLCVQDQAVDRPTMLSIISMLLNETDRPRPKEPLFTFERRKPQSRQNNDNEGSANEATFTASMLEGR